MENERMTTYKYQLVYHEGSTDVHRLVKDDERLKEYCEQLNKRLNAGHIQSYTVIRNSRYKEQ